MKTMTVEQIKKLNTTKIKGAVQGKKGLQLPLEETAKHIAEHGDYTVATSIVQEWQDAEVNLSHEAMAAIKWFVKYVGLAYDKESKAFNGWSGAQFVKDNYQAGRANPYYNGITIAKEPEFDLDAEVSKLISKANKMLKTQQSANDSGKVVNITVNRDHLEALKVIVAA